MYFSPLTIFRFRLLYLFALELKFIGIDLISYGLGATDKFQGTGVYSGIKMEREKKEDEDSGTPAPAPTKTEPSSSTKSK
jgi:hypothetical protein